MRKKPPPDTRPLSGVRGFYLAAFALASLIYASFAFYLYLPHFKNFDRLEYLLVINSPLAALGCYVLSRRWAASYSASFLAGAVYGFGPFMLGLAGYHSFAGLLCAALPWLFCPAAFVSRSRFNWLAAPLAVIPFAAIVIFFRLAACIGFFPVPAQIKPGINELVFFFVPIVAAVRNVPLLGFYHVPVSPLILGFSMLCKARRLGILVIVFAGLILAMCPSLFDISPIIWQAIPLLGCCVFIAVGCQGIISAGPADKKWLLAIAAVMAALSIITLLLAAKYGQLIAGLGAGYVRLFAQSAKMYILAAIAMTIFFFTAHVGARLILLRKAALLAVMVFDIFFSARFITDHIL